MPLYDFECSKCKKNFTELFSLNDEIKFEHCGEVATRKYSPCGIKIAFRPYRSEFIDDKGKKIYFNTQREKESYHTKHGFVDVS